MLIIRPEKSEDFAAVRSVNRLAFGQDNEARLVDTLRESTGFIPELSLVADRDGQIVGHILFSPAVIETAAGETPVLVLAPMAVLPEFQNRGIGSALVRAGLEACRRLGHSLVSVLGHPNYYPRFGFSSAREMGIEPPFPVPDEVWMAQELKPGSLKDLQGTLRYPEAFKDI